MNCVATPLQNGFTNSANTPEPHYVPGYAGYVPQAKYRPGNTYGMTSHRILLDPCIHMSPRSILNSTQPQHCPDDFGRAALGADPQLTAQMALASSRGQQQYTPETAGYTGFIPRFQTILGHTYSPSCNRAMANIEQDQWRDRLFTKELESLDKWKHCHKSKPWDIPDVQGSQNSSPCCSGGGSTRYDSAPNYEASAKDTSGCGCERTLEYVLLNKERPSCDYGDRRMFGCATEQILQQTSGDIIPRLNAFRISRPPVDRIQEIYHGCEGLKPNYCGHIPGEKFRIGRTFTASTRNAKRAIKPVYHKPLCYPPTFKLN